MADFKVHIAQDSYINKQEEKAPLVAKKLIPLISVYAFITLLKDLLTLLYFNAPSPKPVSTTFVANTELFFFGMQTVCMLLTIFSLRKTINNFYPNTKKLVNSAVTIWLAKLFINLVVIILNIVTLRTSLNPNYFVPFFQALNNISLFLNISLLACGFQIYMKNKLPHGNIWLGLGITQVVNFLLNMLLPFFVHNEASALSLQSNKLLINYVLLILKLFFVFLLLIKYSKYKGEEELKVDFDRFIKQ